jgi:hypothetical protein
MTQFGLAILLAAITVALVLVLFRTREEVAGGSSPPEGVPLERGDRVFVTGGYDRDPEWLEGGAGHTGTLERFIPGQDDRIAAVVRTDGPVTDNGITGQILVMELRLTGASWVTGAVAHIELCDFEPEATQWQDRRRGEWIESHASIRQVDNAAGRRNNA